MADTIYFFFFWVVAVHLWSMGLQFLPAIIVSFAVWVVTPEFVWQKLNESVGQKLKSKFAIGPILFWYVVAAGFIVWHGGVTALVAKDFEPSGHGGPTNDLSLALIVFIWGALVWGAIFAAAETMVELGSSGKSKILARWLERRQARLLEPEKPGALETALKSSPHYSPDDENKRPVHGLTKGLQKSAGSDRPTGGGAPDK